MDDYEKEIVDMFSVGISMRKIAEHFDVTYKTISEALKKIGYTSYYKEVIDEQSMIDECETNEKCSLSQLSQKYNIEIDAVAKILKKNGIAPSKFIDLDESLICEMYTNGETLNDMAAIFGVSNTLIKNRLLKHGVSIRGKSIANRKHFYDEKFFQNINDELKAYWLGFFFADGHVGSNLKTCSIELKQSDSGHIQKFADAVGYNDELTYRTRNTNFGVFSQCGIVLTSSNMASDLISHGCTPRKTHHLDPPIGLPEKFNRHFIRGILDGDGCIFKRKVHTGFNVVGDFSLLDWISRAGPETLNGPRIQRTIFELSTQKKSTVESWFSWLYEDCSVYLDRKYDLAVSALKEIRSE